MYDYEVLSVLAPNYLREKLSYVCQRQTLFKALGHHFDISYYPNPLQNTGKNVLVI